MRTKQEHPFFLPNRMLQPVQQTRTLLVTVWLDHDLRGR